MNESVAGAGKASVDEELRFGFGENWADYVERNFSDERLEISKQHLLGFLKLEDLKGKTFLDIGCGSGLHSLAAWKAGADRIVSIDYDPNSVATTIKLHNHIGAPDNWTISQGSALDGEFMNSLPKADIVYSWGVLHHTGSMWEAIEKTAGRVAEKGVFYIALYSSDVYVSPPAEYWLKVKRSYNQAGSVKKAWMEFCYAFKNVFIGCLIQRKNPFAYIREYRESRGMSFWHDVRDWLGGYPMEFAGNKETELFAREKLNMELIHQKAGAGNTEFLFRPMGAENYWDEVASSAPLYNISGPFTHLGGHAWSADLKEHAGRIGGPGRFMLYENGSPVGWPETAKRTIKKYGRGRYNIEGGNLVFSSTDNSDPNSGEKRYQFRPDFA